MQTRGNRGRHKPFEFIAATLPKLPDPAVIWAAGDGALGMLDLTANPDPALVRRVAEAFRMRPPSRLAVRIDADRREAMAPFEAFPFLHTVVVAGPFPGGTEMAERRTGLRVLREVLCQEDAELANGMGYDGLVACGNEGAGRVAEETNFILLQRLCSEDGPPVFARGGIGPRAAAACLAVGAVGVVLDGQLALTDECALPERTKAAIRRARLGDGVVLGGPASERFRLLGPAGSTAAARLEEARHAPGGSGPEWAWIAKAQESIDWSDPVDGVWPLGQEAALARELAATVRTVGGILKRYDETLESHLAAIGEVGPLGQDAPLARAHGTRHPIVQGPMTRVSDEPAFARAVGDAGALPFIGLAMMDGAHSAEVLARTAALMEGRPWGVGVLGFVPEELRCEQLAAIEKASVPYAIVAGARPGRVLELEARGVAAYLHAPSPELLKLFLREGVRRFVFEGRECGGHVGPVGSLALWEAMVETLLSFPEAIESAETLHVLFAGGIHDARSAAAAMAMAAPLAVRGAKLGVLMGTAYLFTEEIVRTGAVTASFQRTAIECRRTALLDAGGGHVIRCAETPAVDIFERERHRLRAEEAAAEVQRKALEDLTIGRLRLASKGIWREGTQLVEASATRQAEDGVFMLGQLAGLRRGVTDLARLHDDVSEGGSRRLSALAGPLRTPAAPKPSAPLDIAITGLACLMPGARDAARFWANNLAGLDAVGPIPRYRFDPDRVGHADGAPLAVREGGFLDPVPFDAVRFGIPPAAMASIEPMQLLALATADAALRDAGLDRREFDRSTAAVVMGVSGGLGDLGIDFALRTTLDQYVEDAPQALFDRLPKWSEDVFPGILINLVAGRISNRLDLGGPNYTVDAACGSSLAAVQAAARELVLGNSDLALAGGVDTLQNPFSYQCFSETRALSPRARCRTFDASADGIVISEGVGVLVMKRLADAERDGDRIYAVLRGLAGASDGRDRSLTAPGVGGQYRVLSRAYAQAGVDPATVSLVEAHGTGTVAGDEAELAALAGVYAGAPAGSCTIGSVKSMIGHTKAAAGAAGLIRAALALHHRTLPPTIHVAEPAAVLRDRASPFRLTSRGRPWPRRADRAPRRAAVSSFGFGGTNFHAVLEEHEGARAAVPGGCDWPVELFVFETAEPGDLVRALDRLEAELDADRPLRAHAAALATEARAANATHRLAIVAASTEMLRTRIAVAREALKTGASDPRSGVYLRSGPAPGRVAFLFSGQGSQRVDMLESAALWLAPMRDALDRADRHRAAAGQPPVTSILYPPTAFDAATRRAQEDALADTRIAQPALAALEMGLCRMLDALGVTPSLLAGHSFGELVALWAAGAYDDDILLKLATARGEAMGPPGKGTGAMLAVLGEEATVREAIEGLADVHVANLNAPRQVVLAGLPDALDTARKRLDDVGLRSVAVPTRYAFHSPLVAPARKPFAKVLNDCAAAAPRLPVFANATAAPYGASSAGIRKGLAEQMVRPVRFADTLRAMRKAGAGVFIEIGPGETLTRFVEQTLADEDVVALACDRGGDCALTNLLSLVGNLFALGIATRPDALFAGRVFEHDQDAPRPEAEWKVDGGAVRRADAPGRPPERIALTAAPVAPPVPVEPRVADDEIGRAMADHHALMKRFLDTHTAVMTAYLSGSELPAAEAPDPADMPVPKELVVARAQPSSPLASAEPTQADRASPEDRLIKILANRTGYPRDVLRRQERLEADLGIDSIKQVEVIGQFIEQAPREAAVRLREAFDTLTRARTLGELIDRVTELSGSPGRTGPMSTAVPGTAGAVTQLGQSPEPAVETAPAAPLPFATFAVAPATPLAPTGLHIGRVVLIADPGSALAPALAEMWRARGEVAVLLQLAPEAAGGAAHAIRCDASDPASVADAVDKIRQRYGSPEALVHICPDPGQTIEDGAEAQRRLAFAFLLTRTCLEGLNAASASGRALLAVVTCRGGDFGFSGEKTGLPSDHGVAALLRTMSMERPGLRTRIVDREPEASAAEVFAELSATVAPAETGLSKQGRVMPVCAPAGLSHAAHRPAYDAQSVFLVLGGARGVMAAIAKGAAFRYRSRMILAGRSYPAPAPEDADIMAMLGDPRGARRMILDRLPPGARAPEIEARFRRIACAAEVAATVEALRAAGCETAYRQADLTAPGAVSELVEEVLKSHGRIDLVIHGAGVIEDRLIADKDPASFDRVVRTKLAPAFELCRRLGPDGVRRLLLISSVSGAFGNPGQADYAAANATMDGLARAMSRRTDARVMSLLLGPWGGAGMARPEIRERLAERGVETIAEAAGVAACLDILDSDGLEPCVVLGRGPWSPEAEPGLAHLVAE